MVALQYLNCELAPEVAETGGGGALAPTNAAVFINVMTAALGVGVDPQVCSRDHSYWLEFEH